MGDVAGGHDGAARLRALADLFAAVADPTRLRILALLRDRGETPVEDLVAEVGLSQPAVSHHLRTLRTAGLVESRKDGCRRPYRLTVGGEAACACHRTVAAALDQLLPPA